MPDGRLANIMIIHPFRDTLTPVIVVVHRRALLDILANPPAPRDTGNTDLHKDGLQTIPWERWGPAVTRWMDATDIPTD
jgi:hypothetical protein